MEKKYIVRLADQERNVLRNVVNKLKGSSQKVRRAQVLLKADADGPNWTDKRIAEAFSCRTKTVENIRQRLVRDGFEIALNGKKRDTPPRAKRLDGEQEAKVIALRLGEPPKGFANWTLRLLAKQAVELEIVESVSHETVRKTLKKNGMTRRKIQYWVIPHIEMLREETHAWATSSNDNQRGVDWQFTIENARHKLKPLHPNCQA